MDHGKKKMMYGGMNKKKKKMTHGGMHRDKKTHGGVHREKKMYGSKVKMMGGGMSTMPRMKAAMGKYASISDMEKKCASMTNVNIKVYG
tara:strand:- start:3632 stop:3898 length:267 start_codon:yes stop_codon:yes gene_type:complete